MNKTEFSALPPDLQRDVRLAVAIGWPLEDVWKYMKTLLITCTNSKEPVFRAWRPTTDRSVWAGLLEAFPLDVINWTGTPRTFEIVFVEPPHSCDIDTTENPHLPTAIVLEVIRRDPFGHLGRAGL